MLQEVPLVLWTNLFSKFLFELRASVDSNWVQRLRDSVIRKSGN